MTFVTEQVWLRRDLVRAARAWLLGDDCVERWSSTQVPASRVKEAAQKWPGGSFAEIPGVAHGNGVFDAAPLIGESVAGFLSTMS
jgi:hypothetical protein